MTRRAEPYFDHSSEPNPGPMPAWVRQSLADGGGYSQTARLVHQHQLTTVCEEARCPNRGECWSRGTATFMLLGDTCTRACAFCSVATGRPAPPEPDEPERIAAAAAELGVHYAVLTSVNRDELPDGGAGQFAATIRALWARLPKLGIELLTPDFRGCADTARALIHDSADGRPLVWGHNMETVPSLYSTVRRGADYRRSLELLASVAALPGISAKSALMLGLGERPEEVRQVMVDLRDAGVSRLALGQYLRPTRRHHPVVEYVLPERFDAYADEARELGFEWVKAGPMVRSSYHAESGA